MGDENARIRLKLGAFEVEYEGQKDFLEDGLINLAEKALALYKDNRGTIPQENAGNIGAGATTPPGALDHSTNTIAAHLNASTGPDLIIAAAAHLVLVKGQEKFSRKDINDEMKEATTYYKSSISSNLSKSLDTLVKAKRLNQMAKGVYALAASEKKSLEEKLAQ